MTADWFPFPPEVLRKISSRITNEVNGVVRAFLLVDLSRCSPNLSRPSRTGVPTISRPSPPGLVRVVPTLFTKSTPLTFSHSPTHSRVAVKELVSPATILALYLPCLL